MNPSERIKAALARPEAERRPTPKVQRPAAAVETTLPLLGDATSAASSQNSNVSASAAAKTEAAHITTAESNRSNARWIYLGAAAIVLIAVSVLVIRQISTSPQPSGPPSKMQVAVKTEGNGLLSVSWNPQSLPVAKAREGRLVIVEPNQQSKVVPLRADALKLGHVYYESSAEGLEFRLEVVQPDGAVTSESVQTQPSAGKPGPFLNAQEPAPDPKSQVAATPAKQERPAPVENAVTAPVSTVTEPPQPQPAPRTFTPPPQTTTRQPTEEARAVVLDPTTLPSGISAPAHVNLPQLNVVPPPTAKASPPPPASRTAGSVASVQPATLIRKVAPVYPPMARSARIQGTVRFTATVDKFGRVQNLQLISGPQLLVAAATEAVKKWQYRPMMMNGQPTEVITQIEVKFSITQ